MCDNRQLDTLIDYVISLVAVAIQNQPAEDILKGFNFNNRSMLNAILYRPYTLDTSSGEIEIVDLVPINHIAAPPNSTHVSFTAAWGKVNIADDVSDLSISPA